MKMLIGVLITAGLCFVSGGCSGDSADDGTQARVAEKNEKLKEIFSRVVGVYTGDLHVRGDDRPIKAEILVYMDSIPDEVDENGIPKSRIILRSQFRLPYAIGILDDHILQVNYDPYSGQFTMTQSGAERTILTACPVGPKDPELSLTGQFKDGVLKARVRRTGGNWAEITAERNDTKTDEPVLDQYKRLADAYLPVAGTYLGDFQDTDKVLKIEVSLVLVDTLVDGGNSFIACPALRGQYRRLDLTNPEIGILSVSAVYYPWDSRILISASGSNAGLPGSKQVTIFGYWKNGVIDGTFDWFGRFGPIQLKKKK